MNIFITLTLLLQSILLVNAVHQPTTQSIQPFGPSIPSKFFTFNDFDALEIEDDIQTSQEWLTEYLTTNFGLELSQDYQITDSYSSKNGVDHVFLRQLLNGIPVQNALMNINMKNKSVLSLGSSFIHTSNSALTRNKIMSATSVTPFTTNPTLSPIEALTVFSEYLNIFIPQNSLGIETLTSLVDQETTYRITNSFSESAIPAVLRYIYTEGEMRLVWDLTVDLIDNWYNVHVDSESGKLLSVIDWVSQASYNVFPFGLNDPSDGERSIVQDPANKIASPDGWHVDRGQSFKSTRGNNVVAQNNPGIR